MQQRFDRLVVIRKDEQWKGRKLKLICRCDCGREVSEYARNLQRRDSTAIRACSYCKELLPKNRKPIENVLLNRLYWIYKNQAKRRGKQFLLSVTDTNTLFKGSCHYCGNPGGRRYGKKSIGEIFINGIDRLDSSGAYELKNVVSCCPTCNFMKHTLAHDDFLRHIEKIYHFFGSVSSAVMRYSLPS